MKKMKGAKSTKHSLHKTAKPSVVFESAVKCARKCGGGKAKKGDGY